ncbi:MAG: patatin [Sphingobacteriales bacterium]|nr:MAG: patatin [Sphingobacteriales bacterium]
MKVGVVLSGGGIRGIAHLGVLTALKNAGLKINHISGTSAGAIVGALYANGVDPYDVFEIIKQKNLLRFLRPAIGLPALFNFEHLSELLEKYLPKTFEELSIPLTIAATNFNEGKLTYFFEGELIRKVLASSCIPGLFSPVLIDGINYVDGGVLNNFPVEPLINKCDYIIGSSCNHLPYLHNFKNIKSVMQRAAVLSLNFTVAEKLKHLNLFIEPIGLGATSIFDTKKADKIYTAAFE